MPTHPLAQKNCTPCTDAKPEHLLSSEKIQEYLNSLIGWELSEKGKQITKEFLFTDFLKAMAFVEQVADVAQEADHHPDIHVFYNKVRLDLYTHAVGGLTENDFIVAARVDSLWLI